jgi:hypothetical protein
MGRRAVPLARGGGALCARDGGVCGARAGGVCGARAGGFCGARAGGFCGARAAGVLCSAPCPPAPKGRRLLLYFRSAEHPTVPHDPRGFFGKKPRWFWPRVAGGRRSEIKEEAPVFWRRGTFAEAATRYPWRAPKSKNTSRLPATLGAPQRDNMNGVGLTLPGLSETSSHRAVPDIMSCRFEAAPNCLPAPVLVSLPLPRGAWRLRLPSLPSNGQQIPEES